MAFGKKIMTVVIATATVFRR